MFKPFTSDNVHCFICYCMSDLEIQERAEILGKCNGALPSGNHLPWCHMGEEGVWF